MAFLYLCRVWKLERYFWETIDESLGCLWISAQRITTLHDKGASALGRGKCCANLWCILHQRPALEFALHSSLLPPTHSRFLSRLNREGLAAAVWMAPLGGLVPMGAIEANGGSEGAVPMAVMSDE